MYISNLYVICVDVYVVSSSYCFDWKLQFVYVWVKISIWKDWIYVAVAVGSIQGKSRFAVAGGESRNSTVAVGGTLVFNKNSFKR